MIAATTTAESTISVRLGELGCSGTIPGSMIRSRSPRVPAAE